MVVFNLQGSEFVAPVGYYSWIATITMDLQQADKHEDQQTKHLKITKK